MTIRRRTAIAFATVALGLAACGGDDASTSPGQEETATSSEGAAAEADAAEVAATVNDTEIPRSVLDSRVEDALATPQLAQMAESDASGDAEKQVRASVLSQLIVNQLVLDGAEEMGLEVDDEAIAQTRDELVTEAGGEDAFAEQVAAAGLDEDQLSSEIESIAALRLVREELTGSAEPQQPSEGADPSADPNAGALEEWLIEQVQSAEIEVDPAIGTWDAQQAAVIPAGLTSGGAGQAPTAPQGGEQPAPEGESDSEADAGTDGTASESDADATAEETPAGE